MFVFFSLSLIRFIYSHSICNLRAAIIKSIYFNARAHTHTHTYNENLTCEYAVSELACHVAFKSILIGDY